MNRSNSQFWFPAKAYGFGWGLPVRWQGWLVLLAYFGLLFSGIAYFKGQQNTLGLLIYLAFITAILVGIFILKGERPARWRWGGK